MKKVNTKVFNDNTTIGLIINGQGYLFSPMEAKELGTKLRDKANKMMEEREKQAIAIREKMKKRFKETK